MVFADDAAADALTVDALMPRADADNFFAIAAIRAHYFCRRHDAIIAIFRFYITLYLRHTVDLRWFDAKAYAPPDAASAATIFY